MSRTLRLSTLIGLLVIVIAKPSAVWATQSTSSNPSIQLSGPLPPCRTSTIRAQSRDSRAESAPLAPAIQVDSGLKPRNLQTLLALPRIDASLVEPFYNDAIVDHGNIDDLLIRLKQQSDDAARSKRVRANALLISSHLQWRHGQLAAALQSVDQALAIDAHDGASYQKAVLLDAAGDVKRAQEWYQRALAQSADSRLRENIRLRLTFLDAVDANVESLVQVAKTRDRAFRNRAAVALAILDFNDEALNLYQVFGDGNERFRQHLRLAQWAVKAGHAARAQEEAWKAVDAATLDRDRRYASSILIEAHSLDDSLDQLLVRLDQKAHLTAEEQAVRIDLLRQTGQYQRAIDLFMSDHRGELSPEMQQDLLRMYSDAGQDGPMVAEYRRLISKEPTVTTWPEGLSRHYLEQGDRAGAQGVWDDFLRRNSDLDALLQGAESMAAFGLHDLAIAATEKAVAHNSDANIAARVRLAQFGLYLDRGLNAEAESALAALDQVLPAQSEYRVELADAYERIDKPHMALKLWDALARAKGGLSVDEKMRLAWLLDSTGQRDAALNVWKELWATDTQSARRRLIEDRLLMLAAELGSLGDIAVELEEKLANRTAGPKDASLLISIYTKVGDSASAVEVITEYFSKGDKSAAAEMSALKEQAQVYLALNEFPEFGRVTRRLLEIDPANKVEYLQALLLNRIESGPRSGHDDDQSAEIREWLTALHEVGGGAVGGEFEAGVLDLAGLRDEAVDAYRRALAEHPERGDNHLLLADLLKQSGRQAEAVAGLQYLTEVADDDDVFLIALDGLANMQTGNTTTLKWAQRRALERLTARDDKLYLYEMLSELAEESRDAKIYVSALENALAHASSRRSHVLRELLASTAEVTTYAAGQGLHRPDPKRNLVYARRLIALGEDLPPDVYVNLGKTFLKMNDAGSAVRAFNLAVDRTGRPSITTEAAKLFDQAGYDREAIQQYERALVGNSGDIQAMYKLARLRDRVGLASSANELYRRGLFALFSRQTRMVEKGLERNPPALDTLVTLEFRRYYPFLLRGFISTLPAAEEGRFTTLASIESAFDQELAQARSGEGTPAVLASYPRLTVMAQAMRRVAFAADAPDIADGVEAALVRYFANDTDLTMRLAQERVSWGFADARPVRSVGPSPATTDQAWGSTPTAVALQRALDREDFRAAVGITLFRNDQASALAAYRQWVRAAGLPKPLVKVGTTLVPDRSATIPEVAAHAWARLDADHFRSLAQFVRNLVTEQEVYAEKLLASARFGSPLPGEVPILARLERSIEQPLLSEDRLMRLINKVQSWRDVDVPFVLGRLSPANQIEVLGRYAKSSEIYWDRLFASIGVVLSKPLEQAHAAQLLATLDVAFGVVLKKTDGGYALANFMNHKFTATVHESNVGVVDAIERGIAERYPSVFKVGYFKASLLRDLGRDREALSAFVDAALQMYVADGHCGDGRAAEPLRVQELRADLLRVHLPEVQGRRDDAARSAGERWHDRCPHWPSSRADEQRPRERSAVGVDDAARDGESLSGERAAVTEAVSDVRAVGPHSQSSRCAAASHDAASRQQGVSFPPARVVAEAELPGEGARSRGQQHDRGVVPRRSEESLCRHVSRRPDGALPNLEARRGPDASDRRRRRREAGLGGVSDPAAGPATVGTVADRVPYADDGKR